MDGHDHPTCPGCKAELCGGLIRETIKGGPYSEEEIRSMYGDSLCYSRVIGVEVPGKYDGVSYWKYPCCNLVIDRFTGLVTEIGDREVQALMVTVVIRDTHEGPEVTKVQLPGSVVIEALGTRLTARELVNLTRYPEEIHIVLEGE